MDQNVTESVLPERDRPLVLLDLLAVIEERQAAGAPRAELERMWAEYRQLRQEL